MKNKTMQIKKNSNTILQDCIHMSMSTRFTSSHYKKPMAGRAYLPLDGDGIGNRVAGGVEWWSWQPWELLWRGRVALAMLFCSTNGSQVQYGCRCCVRDTAAGEPAEDTCQPHAGAWWMLGEQGMEEATSSREPVKWSPWKPVSLNGTLSGHVTDSWPEELLKGKEKPGKVGGGQGAHYTTKHLKVAFLHLHPFH